MEGESLLGDSKSGGAIQNFHLLLYYTLLNLHAVLFHSIPLSKKTKRLNLLKSDDLILIGLQSTALHVTKRLSEFDFNIA